MCDRRWARRSRPFRVAERAIKVGFCLINNVLRLPEECNQCGVINWFAQVVVETGCSGAGPVVFLAMAADADDDGTLGAQFLTELCRNLVAIHTGKPEIKQHELRSVDARRLDGRRPVVGRLDVMSQEFQ